MAQTYNDFIYELLLRTDKLQHFKGEIKLEYDYDREEIVVAVENPEDAVALAHVDYTLVYTKINEEKHLFMLIINNTSHTTRI